MDKVLRFRVATDEAELLKSAASEAGLDFSEWARTRLLREARYVTEGNGDFEDRSREGSRGKAARKASVEAGRAEGEALLERAKEVSAPKLVRPTGRPDPDKIAEAQERFGMASDRKRK